MDTTTRLLRQERGQLIRMRREINRLIDTALDKLDEFEVQAGKAEPKFFNNNPGSIITDQGRAWVKRQPQNMGLPEEVT